MEKKEDISTSNEKMKSQEINFKDTRHLRGYIDIDEFYFDEKIDKMIFYLRYIQNMQKGELTGFNNEMRDGLNYLEKNIKYFLKNYVASTKKENK